MPLPLETPREAVTFAAAGAEEGASYAEFFSAIGRGEDRSRAGSAYSGGGAPYPPSPLLPPSFAYLDARFISEACNRVPHGDGGPQSMVLNSRLGVPVQTDLFKGRALLLVRPVDSAAEDPHYHEVVFSKKKRRLEVQLQGRFRRAPRGVVYCGGEVTERMRPGLATRGLCNMLLRLLGEFSGGMRYSFGSDGVGGEGDAELPHIVFPAWSFFDRIVVTEPGGAVPTLGTPFEESPASVAQRRRTGAGDGAWNARDTFSLSFNSIYLDLATWRLVNLPVTKDLDLAMFWGEGLLRLVMYEVVGAERRHSRDDIVYYLGVEMEFLGFGSKDDEAEQVEENSEESPWDKAQPGMRKITSYSDLAASFHNDDDREIDAVSDIISDAASDTSFGNLAASLHIEDDRESDNSKAVSEVILDNNEEDGESMDFDTSLLSVTQDTLNGSAKYEITSAESARINEINKKVDLVCPGWVELWRGKGKSHRYTSYFAIADGSGQRAMFREWKRIRESLPNYFDGTDLVGLRVSPRASSMEKQRRFLGLVLVLQSVVASPGVLGKTTECDRKFLMRPASSVSRPATKSKPLLFDFVARALSERHWREECIVVTEKHISFHQPGSKHPKFRIDVKGIVSVSALDKAMEPNFPSFCFVEIVTVGRTTYIMLSLTEKQQALISVVSGLLMNNKEKVTDELDDESDELHLSLDDPVEVFLQKSTLWDTKQRRLLNCQDLYFCSFGGKEECDHPCNNIQTVLARAFDLQKAMTRSKLLRFLQSASHLKTVDVHSLSEKERLVFFLNLYHVMILHAFYIVGAPSRMVKWASYFDSISYQCCDDIFSIAELEHCIIRANMSVPAHLVAKLVIPKAAYTYALRQADFRINFALNCGSLSNPKSIIIYDTQKIDEQLDMATEMYLKNSMSTMWKGGKCVVTLPRICSWYSADFGSGRFDIVMMLEKYSLHYREGDLKRFRNAGDLKVKYLPYNYKCRQLSLLKSHSI